MITVIGLGIRAGDLPHRAIMALRGADCVLLKSECPAAEALREEGISYRTLDFLLEEVGDFDTHTKSLVAEVENCAAAGNVFYCVEGSVFEDGAARALIKGGANFIDGASGAQHAAILAGLGGSFTAVPACALRGRRITFPLVVYGIEDRALASEVKLLLCEKMSEHDDVLLFEGDSHVKIPLCKLDERDFSPRSTLIAFETPLLQKTRFDFEDVVTILRRLRAPDGCPWDRAQTHESIRINAIEEAYELVDAIDLKDSGKICEEAGDVLMQALFHTLIEEEKGNFTVGDMLKGLCDKLISRHTHVFGNDLASSAEGALSVWDKNKMAEKGQTSYSQAVNDVPLCFPALLRAQKLCKRVEKGGWDPATMENVEEKLMEEFRELKCAYGEGNQEKIYEELGDFLLCAAWLCRAVGKEGETALLDAGKKLQRRYTAYEALVRADGKDPLSLTKEERDNFYRRVKDAK